MRKRAFGDLEQSILNILRSGQRLTVAKVQEALGGDDKYTTVMTVMARLADKKILGREKRGLRYEYWHLDSEESQQTLLEKVRSKLFGVKTVEMVSYLIDEADDLSPEDLESVEKMIAEAKKKYE